MLAGVVPTDDRWGGTAGRGDGHGVVDTVSDPGSVSSGTGHGGGGGAAGEGLGDVELVKVEPQQDDVGVCSADCVYTLKEENGIKSPYF